MLADPNVAFLLLVLGALAIYWEAHAPGMFVPGLLGVLLLCAGAYGLWQDTPSWYGVVLIFLALILLGIELKIYTNMIAGVVGSILFAIGAIMLVSGPREIAPALAIPVSVAFGAITIFLGFLGMRARKEKLMMGLETLVGEVGVSRTAINPKGTVFVRGEYWQARSDENISAGQPVRVERVQNLTLYVKGE